MIIRCSTWIWRKKYSPFPGRWDSKWLSECKTKSWSESWNYCARSLFIWKFEKRPETVVSRFWLGFRFAFRWPFRVSSSREWAVVPLFQGSEEGSILLIFRHWGRVYYVGLNAVGKAVVATHESSETLMCIDTYINAHTHTLTHSHTHTHAPTHAHRTGYEGSEEGSVIYISRQRDIHVNRHTHTCTHSHTHTLTHSHTHTLPHSHTHTRAHSQVIDDLVAGYEGSMTFVTAEPPPVSFFSFFSSQSRPRYLILRPTYLKVVGSLKR